MDTYVIRIHGREKDNPRLLVGVVEEIGTEGNKSFTNLDELGEILNAAAGGTRAKKRRDATLSGSGQKDA